MGDYVDDLLKKEESRTKGKLSDVRQMQGSIPLPRPGIGTLFTPPVQSTNPYVPSKAPKGMGNAVKGDLGGYRGQEADKLKNFKGDGRTGACTTKKLTYRYPETAIDSKFGPGDKIC